MKILLFDADTSGGVSLRSALLALGHEVESTTNPAFPLHGFSLVLVWHDPASPPPASLLAQLRAAVPAHLPLRAASPLGALFDGILPWPADPAVLSARLAQFLPTPLNRLAHDYNNLLTAIQGHAELTLLNAHLDPNLRHSLSQIHASAARAIDLTRQLRASAGGPSAEPAPPPPPPSSGTILLIDPDSATRRAAHRHLRRAGYVVFEVASPAEGLELMAQIAPSLDAVVLDPLAAGPVDPALVQEISSLRPGIRLVFWSDATEGSIRPIFPAATGFAFAPKPRAEALAGALAAHPVA